MKDDISERISGHVQSHLARNGKKQAEAGKQAHSRDLKGPAAYAAVIVGLLVIAGSAWYGWESTRPPGYVRLFGYSEKMVDGKPVLTGKVNNTTGEMVKERTWTVTYTDPSTTPPRTVLEVDLVLKDVPPGETREWTLEIPGWRDGLRRGVRRKQ